jgi:hypothetical protein
MIHDALAGGDCMRSAKAGLFSGALWGALFLLCGCTVSDEPPVAGSRQLDSLSDYEVVQVCEWARDYMGGYDYRHPESDDDNHTAIHYCPPTDTDLGLPEDNERTYFRWDETVCSERLVAMAGDPCRANVSEFTQYVRQVADTPCADFSLSFRNCTYFRDFDPEM